MRPEWSQQNGDGVLYLVAVPIGQKDDITLRAIHILRNVDLIASENPAATRRLLSHHGVDTPLTSYGPANIQEKAAVLSDRLRRGMHIALVSDCGSPVIADPGALLVTTAHAHNIRVVSVPGPSALTAAVAAAGLTGETFVFLGQLPETSSGMHRRLSGHLRGRCPVVAFCTAKSLALALGMIGDTAPWRRVLLMCDLTRPTEGIVRGTLRQVRQALENMRPAQDITMILTGGTTREKHGPRSKAGGQGQSQSSRRISTR